MVLETDASGLAIGGTLSENGRPLAFISHRLSETERRWSAAELEAYAIVYAARSVRPFLAGRKFTVLTDQRGIAYLFDARPKSAIKNTKLSRWRMDMAEFDFVIEYRPGAENSAADALSRVAAHVYDSERRRQQIEHAHCALGHAGVTRLMKYIERYDASLATQADVREVVTACEICATNKPKFYKPAPGQLINATRPWQTLSVDFVGPKPPTSSGKRFILTVIDEFSRFPFAFALSDATATSVVSCLRTLFTLFGPPERLHSDRGTQFESRQLREFLDEWHVRKTRTTPYHPQGNGQCERLNGTLWKAINLLLAERKLAPTCWDVLLPTALHCIRSLPSRPLNFETPHEQIFTFARRDVALCDDADSACTQENNNGADELPAWLQAGQRALYRNNVRAHKDAPIGTAVTIVRPLSRAHVMVRFADGREDTVSSRHLARLPPPTEDTIAEELPLTADVADLQRPAPKAVTHTPDQTVTRYGRAVHPPDRFAPATTRSL